MNDDAQKGDQKSPQHHAVLDLNAAIKLKKEIAEGERRFVVNVFEDLARSPKIGVVQSEVLFVLAQVLQLDSRTLGYLGVMPLVKKYLIKVDKLARDVTSQAIQRGPLQALAMEIALETEYSEHEEEEDEDEDENENEDEDEDLWNAVWQQLAEMTPDEREAEFQQMCAGEISKAEATKHAVAWILDGKWMREQATGLTQIVRLADATGCPKGTPPKEWLLDKGLLLEALDHYEVTPEALALLAPLSPATPPAA